MAWWPPDIQPRSTYHTYSGGIFKVCLLDQALPEMQLEEMKTVLVLQSVEYMLTQAQSSK